MTKQGLERQVSTIRPGKGKTVLSRAKQMGKLFICCSLSPTVEQERSDPTYNIISGITNLVMSIRKVGAKCAAVKKEDFLLNMFMTASTGFFTTKESESCTLEYSLSASQSDPPRQKKLNSSIRNTNASKGTIHHIEKNEKKNSFIDQSTDFNVDDRVRFSIIKTISLCYVPKITKISKQIHYINKAKTQQSPQPNKDIIQPLFVHDGKFLRINQMAPKVEHMKELVNRNKNLMKVNEQLLLQNNVLHEEIAELISQLAKKTQILEFHEQVNQGLKKQMEEIGVEKKERQERLNRFLSINEQLVRENNNIKTKMRQNIKFIHTVRSQLGGQQHSRVARSMSLVGMY